MVVEVRILFRENILDLIILVTEYWFSDWLSAPSHFAPSVHWNNSMWKCQNVENYGMPQVHYILFYVNKHDANLSKILTKQTVCERMGLIYVLYHES